MKCPNCQKSAIAAFKPFCSERCKQIDLGRWLKGVYVVPGRDGESLEPAVDDIDNQG